MNRTPPIPNSYWLPASRILAGEYPGDRDETPARDKLRALLDAGVTTFVDLTAPHELAPYEALLRQEAAAFGVRVDYRRYAVTDMGVPHLLEDMRRILDTMDELHRGGHTVYVHCWGGVGRTGTVVGCHLVRAGQDPDDALAEVARLFATMTQEKRNRHPEGSPQTDAQRRYVREWPEGAVARRWRPDRRITRYAREQARGPLVGLAVGDAVGTTVEFAPPGSFAPVTDMAGGGPFRLAPGQWTDDTSMTLCLAESLLEQRAFDAADQMRRYVRWYRHGHLSSTGRCFDIGNTTRAALEHFERTGEPYSGPTEAHSAGNGSLMRLAPAVLYERAGLPSVVLARCAESSRTTHGARVAVDACRYLGALLLGALAGVPKRRLLAARFEPVPGCWDESPLCQEIAEVADGSFLVKAPPSIRGSGYAAESLEAALWAFASTDSFDDGLLAAVNLGDDADTTGAVYGQLAGAFYGEDAISARWRARLARWSVIDETAEALYHLGVLGGGAPLVPAGQLTARQMAAALVAEHGGDRLRALEWVEANPGDCGGAMTSEAQRFEATLHIRMGIAREHLRLPSHGDQGAGSR